MIEKNKLVKSTVRGRKTSARIIESGMKLFKQKGMIATTIDDVLEDSNTGKSQFFHYFNNKDHFVLEVLKYYIEDVFSKDGEFSRNITSLEELDIWLANKAEIHGGEGCEFACIFASSSNEETKDQKEIVIEVQNGLKRKTDFFRAVFNNMKDNGVLKKDTDSDSLAKHFLSSIKGGVLISRLNKNPEYILETNKNLMSYIKFFAK